LKLHNIAEFILAIDERAAENLHKIGYESIDVWNLSFLDLAPEPDHLICDALGGSRRNGSIGSFVRLPFPAGCLAHPRGKSFDHGGRLLLVAGPVEGAAPLLGGNLRLCRVKVSEVVVVRNVFFDD